MNSSALSSALSGGARFKFGEYLLEPDGTLFHRQKSVHLAAKELAALRLLLKNAGHIVTPQQLQQVLWGNVHVTPDSVPRCISSLRARLEDDECIQTVYKQGYRLTGSVECVEEGSAARLPRLAVVPFCCGPNVAEHVGSAVAEDAAARLTAAQPPIFSMLARDSAFALAARGKSAQEVGEALGADLVMTGTVQMIGNHYRLRMEMIRVRDSIQIWVEDVLLPLEAAASLHTTLVERLAFRMGVSPERMAPDEEGTGMNAHAFDAFLRGRYEWQSLERHRMQDGIRYLQEAAELDPKLTQARVDMVRASVAQELFGYIAPSVAAVAVQQVASTLEGDAAAYKDLVPALAWMKFHVERDLAGAQHVLDVDEEDSKDPWNIRLRALFAASRHDFEHAARLLQAGIESDPYSPWLNAALAWTWHLAGEPDKSLRQAERCLAQIPDHTATRLFAGMILAFHGDLDRAISLAREVVRHSPSFDLGIALHAYVLARRDQREECEEYLERLQWLGHERYILRSFSAPVYVALGDPEGAMAELRAADEDRCPWFFQMLADPRLQPLRAFPEFQAMHSRLKQMEAEARDSLVRSPNPALN